MRETSLKRRMKFQPNVRLACQTFVTGGPVKLSRILKDESDVDLYVGSHAGKATQQIGEEKELALMFMDIRNFTPFIEKQLAFDVIHIIRKLFTTFRKIIAANGGRVIDTAGDAIYAAFGFDGETDTAVRSCVQAALSMLDSLDALNKNYFETHFNHTVEVGIGVHVGKVVVGSVRVGSMDRLIVMGFPVNVAARLQSATKILNNSLVISGEVFAFLKDWTGQYHQAVSDLKGVAGICPVYLFGKPYQGSELASLK
jgi:adenylate cyclase